jgi:hypothetical protein
MRPFLIPLAVPRGRDGADHRADDGADTSPGLARLPGTVSWRANPHAVYSSESLAQALRQLGAYGRDGLPVLSADGHQVLGWITNASVLRAVADQIGGSPRAGGGASGSVPPDPLHGYQVLEVALAPDSAAAGRPLGSVPWPRGSIPVSVLRDRTLTDPDPGLTLNVGDRVSLLTPAPGTATSRSQEGA